jgi:uncharacterized tellurite resistance protein B-like protein
MELLNLLKKATIKILKFENHPCIELDEDVKIQYLNALALITNADSDICDREIEYLKVFIDSFGLSADMLDIFIEFAKNPDEKIVLKMMQTLNTKDIKYNLLVDCIMMGYRDENYCDNEKAMINQYFKMFKISDYEGSEFEYDVFISTQTDLFTKLGTRLESSNFSFSEMMEIFYHENFLSR